MSSIALSRKRKRTTGAEDSDYLDFDYATTNITSDFDHAIENVTRSSAAHPVRPSNRQRLCQRCATIDFDAIFQRQHLTKAGGLVRNLGPVMKWNADSCSLCQLLIEILPLGKNDPSKSHELRSFSSNRILDRGWPAIDTVMLAIGRQPVSPFLVPQSDSMRTIRILEPLVDFQIVKGWLDFCLENHTRTCTRLQHLPSSSSGSSLSSISTFKLIDCETLRIIPASGQQYVTLSYVWGTSPSGTFSDTLPEKVPDTIRDAILVTRRLGLKYLWIDRYCINQAISEEVREQVSKMDLIYNESHLTIIATAGKDPYFGLPGVSSRIRRPQPHGTIGKHLLISALPDPIHNIKGSKWMERGWTYQEGLLSRRRLIFTEQQVYFECSGMHCCEVLDFPLQNLHNSNGQRFKSCYCNGIDVGIFPKQIGSTGWEVVERIEEYSRKSFTNPLDILKGFLGILRAFERSSGEIRHCLGVPVLPQPPMAKDLGRGFKVKAVYKSLKWSPVIGFCVGLCWDVQEVSEKRLGFPSWSWTGWVGKIKWGLPEHEWRCFQGDTDFQVSIQLHNAQKVDWDMFQHSYNEMSSQLSNTLHIGAWASPVQVIDQYEDMNEISYRASVILEDSEPVLWSFRPTTSTPIPAASCIGIHLGHTLPEHHFTGIYLMVVYEVEKGICERVGFGKISSNERSLSNFNKEQEQRQKGNRFYIGKHMLNPWQKPLPKLVKSWKQFQLR